MIKKTLSETIICTDYLPELSKVDNDEIDQIIIKDYLNKPPQNIYDDVELSPNKNITWVMDYARSKFKIAVSKDTLVPIFGTGKIEKPGETGYNRSYHNQYELNRSPDFIVIYCGNTNSGDIIIQYHNFRKAVCYWSVPMEKNKIIIFNGNLNYFMTKNEEEKDRITFTQLCQIY